MSYIVSFTYHSNDCEEHFSQPFASIEEAMAYINKKHFAGDSFSYRLFELGKELPLKKVTVQEPQPPKAVTKFVVE